MDSALAHDHKIAGSSPTRRIKGFCQNDMKLFFSQDLCQKGFFSTCIIKSRNFFNLFPTSCTEHMSIASIRMVSGLEKCTDKLIGGCTNYRSEKNLFFRVSLQLNCKLANPT